MKILLTALNAKFIHSCLAIHLLQAYLQQTDSLFCETAEYTINQSETDILADLYRKKPDVIGFSCYIWNMQMIASIARCLRKILPDVKLLFGGPEVSYDPVEVLQMTDGDFVIRGEGEEPFAQLCRALNGEISFQQVPSLTWRQGDTFVQNPSALPLALAKLPFVYEELTDYDNRIIYYEAQRGCPFNCQYCLSSVDKGVRFQPIDKVKRELSKLLAQQVRQVKFVDRTFNTNAAFAMEIWRFLMENDNGITNFHFEMEADLIQEEMLLLLAKARSGLFQFEIGVQTTNPETLLAIDRRNNMEKLRQVVEQLQQSKNIHLHLDLIAGLPHEGFARFGESFDAVYALSPDQFQLGFLKLLKGSGLRKNAAEYGIVFHEQPPYEVLQTNALSFDELIRLKEIEALVDRYYNSCHYRVALRYLVALAKTPFSFYCAFRAFMTENGSFARPLSKVEQVDALYRFGIALAGCDATRLVWLLKYDCCAHEKPKKLPQWMTVDNTLAQREEIYEFFRHEENCTQYLNGYQGLDTKLIYKTAHIEVFPFDPRSGSEQQTVLAFNYKKKDILGNAAVTALPL